MFSDNKKTSIKDYARFDRETVNEELNSYIEVKIIQNKKEEKNAYLLNEKLKDSNYCSIEFDIEQVFTCTRSLPRHWKTNFSKFLSSFNYGISVKQSKNE